MNDEVSDYDAAEDRLNLQARVRDLERRLKIETEKNKVDTDQIQLGLQTEFVALMTGSHGREKK